MGEIAEKVQAQLGEVKKGVDSFLRQHPHATFYDKLLSIEKHTKVPAAALFGSAVAVLLLIFIAIWGLNNLVDCALFVNPALLSFEALRSSTPKAKADLLLAYWALYAFVQLLEEALSFLLPTSSIVYVAIKMVLLLWAINPVTQGAVVIYQRCVRPYLGWPDRPSPSEAVHEADQDKTGPDVQKYNLTVRLAAADLPQPEQDQPLNRLCVLEVVPPPSRKAVAPEKVKYKTKNDTSARFGDPDWRDDPALIKGLQSDDNFLEVTVFHKGLYSDQFLGKVRVPLKGLSGETELTKPLEDPDGEAQGEGTIQGQLRILLTKS